MSPSSYLRVGPTFFISELCFLVPTKNQNLNSVKEISALVSGMALSSKDACIECGVY